MLQPMTVVANLLVGLVALIHVYIVYLEMVLWDTPKGRAAFDLEPEFATKSKPLAANQGLYNGFLAAGLVFGLVGPEDHRHVFQVFFLACVIVAGGYGAATASRKILVIQALPALLALAAVLMANA